MDLQSEIKLGDLTIQTAALETIRSLPIGFEYAGHTLRQVWRKDHVAIFERSLTPGKPAHEFELVIIRIKAESRTPTGEIVPRREAYPSASEWGSSCWSLPVRMKPFVTDLAETILGIRGSYGAVVRDALTRFKAKPKEARML
jgi:hypothetical protein